MAAAGLLARPASSSEVESMLGQFRAETTLMALPGFYVASAVLFFGISGHLRNPYPILWTSLFLCTATALVWGLYQWNHLASAWALVLGCLVADLSVAIWGGISVAVFLLIIPAGLATLCVSLPAGTLTALACSLLLLFCPASFLAADSELRLTTLLATWCTVALIWMATHPLLSALQWAFSNYERSRSLLEQGRDTQAQLKQTLADLAHANLQLTRLNRLAQGLREAAEDARRAKEQFVASVSHELRTPLNMIIGFSEMIVNESGIYPFPIPAPLAADLEVILRNSQHLSRLINDVLDLTQIEAGQMALTRERVALGDVIAGALIAVRPLFESKALYLETEVQPDLPLVFCDPTRIREVLLNLLSNAGRFTERGGVHVKAWREGDDVVVSVADTGPGIATGDRDRVFKPFQQLDASMARPHGGTGLGLSVSKSFVELHGGRMWLESEEGLGTTFYFRLPIDPPAPVEANCSRWFSAHWYYEERIGRSLARPPALRPRLIVCENGDALCRLLARYLPEVETVPVCTLEEARLQLERVPAQAVLVNGPPTAETLRSLGGDDGLPYATPAILYSLPGLRETAAPLGVADYLLKPVSRDTLLAALDRLHLDGQAILVVDDEPEALRLFLRVLTSANRGYRILTAPTGRHALEVLRTRCPAAVLLDLVMPEMDGYQFLAVKNADPALRDIPVIVLSARDPSGQPIVTNALTVTCAGGLSVTQVLACTQALVKLLSPVSPPAYPGLPTDRPG